MKVICPMRDKCGAIGYCMHAQEHDAFVPWLEENECVEEHFCTMARCAVKCGEPKGEDE